jgi:hypothetical protein
MWSECYCECTACGASVTVSVLHVERVLLGVYCMWSECYCECTACGASVTASVLHVERVLLLLNLIIINVFSRLLQQ